MAYTTSTLIEAEIRADAVFDTSTIPTLAQVENWIDEESAQIDHDACRTFTSTAYSETIDYYGSEEILLEHSPIISVNSVLYSTSELGTSSYSLSDTKVEDTDYTVYKDTGAVVPIFGNWTPKFGRKQIQINYIAGYATTPLTIQKLATKMVALRVLDSLLNNNVNDSNSGGSISVGSISIVDPANVGVGTYQQLNNDIATLKGELTQNFGVYRYRM